MFCAIPKIYLHIVAITNHKKFGPAQNILGPVKGQGKNLTCILYLSEPIQNIHFAMRDPVKPCKSDNSYHL